MHTRMKAISGVSLFEHLGIQVSIIEAHHRFYACPVAHMVS